MDFPPIQACLFDMDGLLINTEDLYTLCSNIVLNKYGRPDLPWSVKAQLMGIPGSTNGDVFHNWAQLPISREQYKQEQADQHKIHFPECQPLPGIALATSGEKKNYELKTSRPFTRSVLEIIPKEHRILGDDPRIQHGRGKPAPDIYLLALQSINSSLPEGVFEDSVLGVEAGRRAGMRALWVPHPNLAAEYKGKEKDVLAGRIGLLPIGNDEQLGVVDDGWAELLASLENFPYEKYGIVPP
ncbi:HAD-like protein [Rostrohypoxylon terebratum]|nr:HAD-like protein [Rostrohypoxylon terebratum]